MECYQDQKAFDFFLRDTLMESKDEKKKAEQRTFIEFADSSVE